VGLWSHHSLPWWCDWDGR